MLVYWNPAHTHLPEPETDIIITAYIVCNGHGNRHHIIIIIISISSSSSIETIITTSRMHENAKSCNVKSRNGHNDTKLAADCGLGYKKRPAERTANFPNANSKHKLACGTKSQSLCIVSVSVSVCLRVWCFQWAATTSQRHLAENAINNIPI